MVLTIINLLNMSGRRLFEANKALIIGLLSVLAACNNYGLRDLLENPGRSNAKNSNSCGVSCRIFVTQEAYDGNLGGITGADQKCMSDPARPSSPTEWKAMLVDGINRRACENPECANAGLAEGFDWVLRPGVAYTRLDGTLIHTASPEGIFAFGLFNSIGAMTGNTWTGFHETNIWTSDENCAGWMANSGELTGGVGNIQSATAGALFSSTSGCGTALWLYCVEQELFP